MRVIKLDVLSDIDRAHALALDFDVLFNNAGIMESGPMVEIPMPVFRSVFETNVFAALDKSYVDACAGHETAYLTFIAGRAGEYRVLEPGLLRAGLGAAFYKDDGSGRAEALNEMLHELVADGTVAAILESYGVDAQAALAGLIHGQ